MADFKLQRVNAVWMQHTFHTRMDERRKIVASGEQSLIAMSTRVGGEAKLHGFGHHD